MVRIPASDEIVKNVLCQEKSTFQEFLYIGRFWPWERKQIGQDFFGIWQHPRERTKVLVGYDGLLTGTVAVATEEKEALSIPFTVLFRLCPEKQFRLDPMPV